MTSLLLVAIVLVTLAAFETSLCTAEQISIQLLPPSNQSHDQDPSFILRAAVLDIEIQGYTVSSF